MTCKYVGTLNIVMMIGYNIDYMYILFLKYVYSKTLMKNMLKHDKTDLQSIYCYLDVALDFHVL